MMQPNCDALGAPRAERAIRVLVADDHPLTRLGIRHALGDGFEVCAEADDAEAAVEAALREQPDICLLDVGMPGNGISAAARIAALLPRAAVVMISAARDDDTLLAALRAGAVGYLPKEMAFTRLPEALLGVLDGEAALPRDVPGRRWEIAALEISSGLAPLEEPSSWAEWTRFPWHHRLPQLMESWQGLPPRVLVLDDPDCIALMRKFGVRDRRALRALFDPADRVRE